MATVHRDPAVSAASRVRGPRDLRIDRYRGTLILLMVAGNYAAGIAFVPATLKHAADVGLTVADLVAPAFVFAIALNFRSSFERRCALDGAPAAYRHFLTRYLALIGVGAIISAGATSVADRPESWGVLQALGAAGLLCLLVIRFGTVARLCCGVALLLAYEYVLTHGALNDILTQVHAGLIGALSWGALLILATVVVDASHHGRAQAMVACCVVITSAALLAPLVPISKHRVSPTYVLVCLALSTLAWIAVDAGQRFVPARAGFLAWWGENPLPLYLLHLVLLGIVTLPSAPWWYAQASLPLALLQLGVLMSVMTYVAWVLHRRHLTVHL